MRRTARVLSVAAMTGAVLAGAAPLVWADPAAEVSPATAQPGGTVTVSVTCDAGGGNPPPSLDATSEAFDEGTVALHLVPAGLDTLAGPAYRGTAKIAPAADLESDPAGTGPDTAWTVDGTCPAAPGGQGKPWSATFTVTRDAPKPPCPDSHGATCPPEPCPDSHGATCPPEPCPEPHSGTCPPAPPVQRGVRAGEGGAFTDSVPALVAGGFFIAVAAGGAVYRLRRRTPGRDA
ncbi:hypothetical protein ABZZ79_36265 [Streptomyces sp. NPDC006458]|uniref:hypothetical protein n=1 Tax=Streptomyces sp. NPDC006458 TaxID=3154302 RepID=UPI0033AA2C22